MKKILIFGVGRFYQNRKKIISPDINIVAFIDNNSSMQGKSIDNIPIISPNKICRFSYDTILLMSKREYADEMKEQLIKMGIHETKISYWEEFYDDMVCGTFKFYCGNNQIAETKKRILIISTYLDYNGGTIVIVYATQVLQKRGYNVILAAPGGNSEFVREIVKKGINIVICPSLPNLHKEEIFWLWQFDIVLVNVFQMIRCAVEISKLKPVLWWIHEPSDVFRDINNHFSEYIREDKISRVNIYAVSRIAQNNFNFYFPERIKNVLKFGIPDENGTEIHIKNRKKLIFSIIGSVIPRKSQDILIQAVALLSDEEKNEAEFWIIGAIGENEYGKKIKEAIVKEPSIKILGELTRYDIEKKYEDIDVVLCPSLEEPMSIAIMEGMMYGKVCVASDIVGMADYIIDGVNGFICKARDCVDLSLKIKWIISHKNDMTEIRLNARKTYEEFFTMDIFGDKLEKAVEDTIYIY